MKAARFLLLALVLIPVSTAAEGSRGHWFVFEARWEGVSQIDAHFSMLVPPWRGGEESFFILLDTGDGPVIHFLSGATGPLTPRANLAGTTIGVEPADVHADMLGERMEIRYRSVLSPEGALRITGFSLMEPTTFSAWSASIGGRLHEASAVGDSTVAVRTGDLDGVIVSTPVLTARHSGRATVGLDQGFIGTIASHDDQLALLAPSGARTELPPGSAQAIDQLERGTWTLEAEPAFRGRPFSEAVYLQGAFVPDLGVFAS